MPTEVQLHGTLSLGDMYRFQYFHTLRRMWTLLVLAVLLLAVGFAYNLAPEREYPESAVSNIWTNLLPIGLVWIVVLGIVPYISARKGFSSQPYLREPTNLSFTDEGIAASAVTAQWTIAWAIVKQVYETNTLFLINHAPNIAVIVPKRFFENQMQVNDWRQLALAHLNSKRIEKSGFVARFC